MKRTWWISSAVLLLSTALLTGCGTKTEESSDSGKLSVVTTIFPAYDFTREVAGQEAEVTMLLQPGTEAHTYEPTPKDIKAIQNCDVFIYTGGENDVWVEDILSTMNTSDMVQIRMVDCVDTLETAELEGVDEHDHEEEHAHEEGEDHAHEVEEHVWTSPVNSMKIVDIIADKLAEKDSEHGEIYQKNAEEYIAELENLNQELKKVVAEAERTTLVFGDRFPILYFAEEYELSYYAAFPGCASDTEPSASTIAFLTDKVKEKNIPVVLKIELSNGKVAETIAESTGAKVLTFETCHNLTKEDFENGENYLTLMERNVETLKEALN